MRGARALPPWRRYTGAMDRLPEELLERINAFRESRLLLTAIELDVFTAIGEGATAAEVASRCNTDARATEMLLNALVAVGMLTKREGVFYNTTASNQLREGAPGERAYGADARRTPVEALEPLDRVRATGDGCGRAPTHQGGDRSFHRHDGLQCAGAGAAGRGGDRAGRRAASARSGWRVWRLCDCLRASFARGGGGLVGPGARAAHRTPSYRAAGVADRVKTRVGDLHQESYGAGYDLVFISAICHMLDPEENKKMLRKSYAALAPGRARRDPGLHPRTRQDCAAACGLVRPEHAGEHAGRIVLQRTGVPRLARRGRIPAHHPTVRSRSRRPHGGLEACLRQSASLQDP
jgi:hypothetical protein